MKPKILIVEDEKTFREVLREFLSETYDVVTAEDGKMAKAILSIQSFDLVISDIQMPHFSGVDLLEWIKQNKPCPVILMTGFSHVLEMQKAHALGVEDFIAKPFTDIEIKEKIERIIVPKKVDSLVVKKEQIEFFPIPIEDFVSQKEASCPVYIKLNEEKYIKILHKGGKVSENKIALFKEKGIKFLHVSKDDFPSLVGFSVQLAKAIAESDSINTEKKNRFFKYTGELLSQQIFSNELDQTACNYAKQFVQSSIEIVGRDNEAVGLLMGLNEHTDYLYAHSLGVSAISVLIAKKIGWESSSLLFKLAFSGLFHDIGKKEIPKELLTKPRFKFTSEEVRHYESHTVRGKEILDSLKNAPREAAFVAYEHHENCLGNGYPRGIDQSEIHPFTKIVNVADIFCNYAMKNFRETKVFSLKPALNKIVERKSFEVDKQAFQALSSLFKNAA